MNEGRRNWVLAGLTALIVALGGLTLCNRPAPRPPVADPTPTVTAQPTLVAPTPTVVPTSTIAPTVPPSTPTALPEPSTPTLVPTATSTSMPVRTPAPAPVQIPPRK